MNDLAGNHMATEESLLIDEETGEIIGEVGPDATTEVLPKLARAIRAMTWRKKTIEEYRDGEIDRILSICNQKVDKLQEQIDYLTSQAKGIMDAEGYSYEDAKKRKLEYPGLGKFRFGVTRQTVVDDGWDEFTEEKKEGQYRQFLGVIAKCIEFKPDKREILLLLQGDNIETNDGDVIGRRMIPGFTLSEQTETFTFKPEE